MGDKEKVGRASGFNSRGLGGLAVSRRLVRHSAGPSSLHTSAPAAGLKGSTGLGKSRVPCLNSSSVCRPARLLLGEQHTLARGSLSGLQQTRTEPIPKPALT